MRKLTLLSAVFLLGILLTQAGFANGTYKYTSKPHLPVVSALTTLDAIYVPANVPVADVRVSLYAKVVMYSSLRITLVSPTGVQVVLKQESGNPGAAPLYGSLGSERSHVLFQDGGNAFGLLPNDRPIAPQTPLSGLNGALSQGWWQIQIVDERNFSFNAIPQDGFLEAWSLYFNEQIIEPLQPFNPPVNAIWPGGASLFGQINGVASAFGDPVNTAQIPNQNGGALLCNYPNDPNVVLGVDGDAFPVVISGHPGAIIGQAANGYPAGRFRVTITVEPNYPGSPIIGSLTEDIAIYFGKVADNQYNPPLPNPPVMGDPAYKAKVPSGWPSGIGTTVNSLLGGGSGVFGGVRLAACIYPVPGDQVGYNRVEFDDLALEQIDNGVMDPATMSFTGPFAPMQQLSSLNGLAVDGLYYVTVYDAYGENSNIYGHVRVTYLQVEYVVGGGEISDPARHQGFVGPLAGVPIPGTFQGAAVGYLSDPVGVIPPYKENAKDQDPILVFWATQKMYPKDAVGTERIMAVDQNNYAPPSATHYHGPYAYPGALDADPLVAGSQVNADVLLLPNGDYNLRVNLMQARYDDDLTDNETESSLINVNPVTLSYYGERVPFWNQFVDPAHVNQMTTFVLAPGQGLAQTFTLFKFPYTTVASIDYKFDKGTIVTPKGNVRMSIWAVDNGWTGAPQTLVARSTTVTLNEYVEGNWRTFPIYPVDGQGNPDVNAGGSVNLPQGTYAMTLDVVGGGNVIMSPYTWGAIPAMKDRYWQYMFGDNFGPLGPYSTAGTRMGYLSTDISAAPAVAFGNTNIDNYANHTLPFRVNMTNMNDFSVNYVRFSSQTTLDEAINVGQPVTPSVNLTANSTQNGLTKDFNIYLGIYDGGNNLLYSDMVNVANLGGIQGYQTITVNMASWTPASGGIYHIKAYLTRKPDDQNPVNDIIEYDLLVQATPVIAYDNGVDRSQLNQLVDIVAGRGMDPVLVNIDASSLKAYENSTIYYLGAMSATAQTELTSAIAQGNNIAFVYDNGAKFGSTIKKIDKLYGIERAGSADYASMDVAPAIEVVSAADQVVTPIDLPEFTSKEDLLTFIASQDMTLKASESSLRKDGPVNTAFDNALPIATASKFGDIEFLNERHGALGIVYTVPSVRKTGNVVVDEAAPTAFVLEQNYPNPFNPSTVISYTLTENSMVTLRVIDVLGREIATLVNQTQDAGSFSISWKGMNQNGIDVPSGTYFYRLDAVPTSGNAAFTSTKKMMLSK